MEDSPLQDNIDGLMRELGLDKEGQGTAAGSVVPARPQMSAEEVKARKLTSSAPLSSSETRNDYAVAHSMRACALRHALE